MHSLPLLYRLMLSAAVPVVFLTVSPSSHGQTSTSTRPAQKTEASSPNAARPKAAASKSANVKAGQIVSIDAAADTLTLTDRTGKPVVYVLTPKTRFTKLKHAATAADFKANDAGVVHFRKSRTDGALLLTEVDDPVSWAWLTELRKATTQGVIQELTDTTLTVTVGADNTPVDYTVSDKTRWEKAGAETGADAFHAGDHVFVVPRSLPSGNIMARAVADSNAGAAQEKERSATSVHGVVLSLDAAGHKLTIKTTAGDTRALAYTDETEFLMVGKPITPDALKVGTHVSVRLHHDATGDESATRVTVDTSGKASSKKRTITARASVKPGAPAIPKKAADK